MKIAYSIGIALILVTCSHTDDHAEEQTLVKIGEFPAEMKENSGMTEYQDLLWNINDSGNEPALFGYNKQTNTLDRKLIIKGAVNTDWEEISQDQQHLYIGDFGNNSGDRQDLRIYIIDKSDLQTTGDSISFSGMINFTYPDQTDFTPHNINTPFDCEAFIAMDDSLILFTKDWQTEQTTLYTLPARDGDFTARKRKKYNVSGLITGAAYSITRKELMLLGYHNYVPFIRIVHNFSLTDLNFSNSIRIDFEKFIGAQTEGIAYSADGSVYVSCEQSSSVFTQTLFRAEI